MIQNRNPGAAALLLASLQSGNALATRDAASAAVLLRSEGAHALPTWPDLAAGARPAAPVDVGPREPGDYAQGWQRVSAGTRTAHHREQLLSSFSRANQAMLRSQSGPNAGRVFFLLPTSPLTQFQPAHFRVLLLRRLRLSLPLTAHRCRCRRLLDPLGDHRAACPQAGVLGPRSVPLERAIARVCREAGARVAENTLIRDLNLHGVHPADERRIEVIANGLPLWNGAQLAIDATLVSPLGRNGDARPRAARHDGAALDSARRRKERTYPELQASRRCRLVVLGLEVGGRWSAESVNFIWQLARARARRSPEATRAATARAFAWRWTNLVSVAAATAFAASLLELPLSNEACVDGAEPPPGDLLADCSRSEPPPASRFPGPL